MRPDYTTAAILEIQRLGQARDAECTHEQRMALRESLMRDWDAVLVTRVFGGQDVRPIRVRAVSESDARAQYGDRLGQVRLAEGCS